MIASNSYTIGKHSTSNAVVFNNKDVGYEFNSGTTNASTILSSPKDDALNIPDNAQQIRKIKSFLNLEENWDSYGAAPIVEHCVQSAIDFVKRLDDKYQEVYFVAPGPNGEVLVELKAEERSIEVIFDEDDVEYAKYENGDVVDEEIYEPGDLDSQLVSWLRDA